MDGVSNARHSRVSPAAAAAGLLIRGQFPRVAAIDDIVRPGLAAHLQAHGAVRRLVVLTPERDGAAAALPLLLHLTPNLAIGARLVARLVNGDHAATPLPRCRCGAR